MTDMIVHRLSPDPESMREYAQWIEDNYPHHRTTASSLRNIADTEERKAAKRAALVDEYARIFDRAWCEFYGTEPMTDEDWEQDTPGRSGSAIRAGIEAVLDAQGKKPKVTCPVCKWPVEMHNSGKPCEPEGRALTRRSWNDLREIPADVVKAVDADGSYYVRIGRNGGDRVWHHVYDSGSIDPVSSYTVRAPYTEVGVPRD